MAVSIAALIGTGLQAYKAYKSGQQKKQATAMANTLRQPLYKVQNEYLENKALAESNAGQGYTSAAQDYLTTQAQQGLGTGIGAISQSGGGVNDIAKLYSAFLRSTDQTAAQSSQIQLGNIERLKEANTAIAGQKNIGWSLNEDRPFETKRKEYRQDAQIADANQWQGMEGVVGGLSAYGTSQLNANMIPRTQRQPMEQNYFNQPAETMTAQQPIAPVLQQRQSPNVDLSNGNGPYGGGGGYYPGGPTDNWQNALNLDYN